MHIIVRGREKASNHQTNITFKINPTTKEKSLIHKIVHRTQII